MVDVGKREDRLLDALFAKTQTIKTALLQIDLFQVRSGVTKYEAAILNTLKEILEDKR